MEGKRRNPAPRTAPGFFVCRGSLLSDRILRFQAGIGVEGRSDGDERQREFIRGVDHFDCFLGIGNEQQLDALVIIVVHIDLLL